MKKQKQPIVEEDQDQEPEYEEESTVARSRRGGSEDVGFSGDEEEQEETNEQQGEDDDEEPEYEEDEDDDDDNEERTEDVAMKSRGLPEEQQEEDVDDENEDVDDGGMSESESAYRVNNVKQTTMHRQHQNEDDDQDEEREEVHERRAIPSAAEPLPEDFYEVARMMDTESAPRMRTTKAEGPRSSSMRSTVTHPLEYLKAYGPMPAGFRPSTIAALSNPHNHRKGGGGSCATGKALASSPGLAFSGISFCDLAVEVPAIQKGGILSSTAVSTPNPPHSVRKMILKETSCKIAIIGAKYVPAPGPHSQIIARRVRVCLWDSIKNKPVESAANHTVNSVLANGKNGTIRGQWKFPESQGTFIRRSSENSFLLRAGAHPPQSLCVLFELCIVVRRSSSSSSSSSSYSSASPKIAELCCGWTKLPLLASTGEFARRGTQVIQLEGGTPYDSGVAIDPLTEAAATNKKQQKIPVLQIKISSLSNAGLNETATLPATFICSFSSVPLISALRQLLLDALVKRGMPITMSWSSPLSEPAIAAFLQIVDNPLLLEALKAVWFMGVEKLSRKDCRNTLILAKTLSSAVFKLWILLGDFETLSSTSIDNDDPELMPSHSPRLASVQRIVDTLATSMKSSTPIIPDPIIALITRNVDSSLYKPFTITETIINV